MQYNKNVLTDKSSVFWRKVEFQSESNTFEQNHSEAILLLK